MELASNQNRNKFHLLAVNVAAELSDVRIQGEEISLSAQNAKVLVAKAGTSALGFRPITDFMISLADDTIRLVNEIGREALAVSRLAVTRLRTVGAMETAERAVKLADRSGATYRQMLKDFTAKTVNSDRQVMQELLQHSHSLVNHLAEIATLMLAAKAMASSAKVEAAGLESQHRQAFLSVAEKLELCATLIRDRVGRNLSLIDKAISQQRNEA